MYIRISVRAVDSAEAGAGTFDSSGAFHGYSNDDTNIPKSQESTYREYLHIYVYIIMDSIRLNFFMVKNLMKEFSIFLAILAMSQSHLILIAIKYSP